MVAIPLTINLTHTTAGLGHRHRREEHRRQPRRVRDAVRGGPCKEDQDWLVQVPHGQLARLLLHDRDCVPPILFAHPVHDRPRRAAHARDPRG